MRAGTETRLEKEINSLSDEILNALNKVFEHIEKNFSMVDNLYRKLGSKERVEDLCVLLANGTIPPTFQDYTAHDCCTAIKNCLNPIIPLLCYYTEEMRSYDFQNVETMKKIIQKCKSKDVLKYRLLERLVQHMEKLIYGNTTSISTSEEELYQNLGNLIVNVPATDCPQSFRLELYAQIPNICKSLLNNFQYLFSPLSPVSDDDSDKENEQIKLLNKTLVKDEELEELKKRGNGCFSFGSNKKTNYPQIEDTPDITACLYGSLSELMLYIEQNFYIKTDLYVKSNIASTVLLDVLYNPPSRNIPIDFSSYDVDVLFSTLLKTFITIGPIITYYTYDLVKYNFSDVKFVKQMVKELKKLNPIKYELLYRIKSHIIDMSRFSDYNSLTKDKLCEIIGPYLIKIHPKEFHKSVLNSYKNQGIEVCKLIVNNREIERILPVNISEQSLRYDNQLPESAYLHDVKIQPFFNRVLLSNSSSINNMSPTTSKFKSKASPIMLSPRGPPPTKKQFQQQQKQQQQHTLQQAIPLPPQLSSTITPAPPLKTKRKLTESARNKMHVKELTFKDYDDINILSSMYSDDGGVTFEPTDKLLLDPQPSNKTIKILQQQISDYQEIINTKNDVDDSKNKEIELNNRIKELEAEVLTWKKKCKASINKLKEKLELINKLNGEINSDKESTEKMVKENSEMKTSYNALKSDLEASRKEYDELNKEKFKMKRDYEKEKRELKEEYEKKIEDIQKLYENEMKMRIELYNELVNLRGNIRVYCRIRPLNSFISIDNQVLAPITILNESELSVDNLMGCTTTYCFDRIFSKDSSQDEVFGDIENFILSALDGFNVCIFAYGQTGSGKTFTMQGTLQNPGIYNHTLQLLFDKIEIQKQYSYQVSISIMEIYNDSIRDLTYPIANRKSLEIKTKISGDNYVEGLVEVPVRTYSDVIPIFNQASKNRSVGAHNLNERSSRSHLIFIITINKTNPVNGETKQSQINLIDLAGSERISKTKAEGDRLKEAQYINKSLSALGEVINHLSSHSKHIPFRNSKLTHFLQQSLTSDSKVAMFVTINPHIDQLSESICSLQFANRCKEVEINQAKRIVSRYAIDQKATST